MTLWQKVKLFGRAFVDQVWIILTEIGKIPLPYWAAMVGLAAVGDVLTWLFR